MDTVQHTSQANDHAPVASFASGLVAAAATVWIWALSASTTFDPPEWTRILGSWLLPIGLVCAVVLGIKGLRQEGRAWAVAGLALAAAAVAGFVVLLGAYG